MSVRKQRELLKVQILDTERLLESMKGHPLMAKSFEEKLNILREELDHLPVDAKEASITLMFSGKPVLGSQGIDANFAGEVLKPLQSMVSADFTHRIRGKVGARGKLNDAEASKLFITALPRGSFGLELTRLNTDMVNEEQLADSLAHITRLIEASTKSDEDFASELDEVNPRTLQYLSTFLKTLNNDEAGVVIESGGLRCNLEQKSVAYALDRVSQTETSEETERIQGTLRGILLDSWRFDFVALNGDSFSGRLSDKLTEEKAQSFISSFFNQHCIATIHKTNVYFHNGRIKESYILEGIEELPQMKTLET